MPHPLVVILRPLGATLQQLILPIPLQVLHTLLLLVILLPHPTHPLVEVTHLLDLTQLLVSNSHHQRQQKGMMLYTFSPGSYRYTCTGSPSI